MQMIERRRSMCNEDNMPVSVKVYYGHPISSAVEIRRFVFRPETTQKARGHSAGIYQALMERIRAVFNGLNLHNLHLCWKDDDGDYVVFSSDDELRVAISNTHDNTLRIYIREKQPSPRPIRNGENETDASGYARIIKRMDQRRHQRRSTRSVSASSARNPNESTNGTSDLTSATQVDSGASTSSGVVEESSETMKESSEESPPPIHCTECRGHPPRGDLYQCTICKNTFLCSECENRGLHDDHIMLRLKAIANGRAVMPNLGHR